MKQKEGVKMRLSWMFKFVFRVFIGIGIILLVNEMLVDRNVIVSIPVNIFSIFTSGMLGFPGVCALYGIAFYMAL